MKGTVTCPKCRGKQKMEIPTKACIPFYTCNSCGKLIEARNNCCIFCDFGDRKCPVSKLHK